MAGGTGDPPQCSSVAFVRQGCLRRYNHLVPSCQSSTFLKRVPSLESLPHGHKIPLPHFTMSNPPEVEVVPFAVNPFSALSCVGRLQGVLAAV